MKNIRESLNENIIDNIKEIVALKFWINEAIKVNFKSPYKLVSGKLSPIYINCRIMISDPEFMNLFNSFSDIILKEISFETIAGGETAGIPFASYLANHLSLPLIYIRKRKKEYGTHSLIEGFLEKGKKVLLVEDLITDAGSKLHFVSEIRKQNGIIKDILVLFDRLQGGKEKLLNYDVNLHSITDIDIVLNTGIKYGLLNQKNFNLLKKYLNPYNE